MSTGKTEPPNETSPPPTETSPPPNETESKISAVFSGEDLFYELSEATHEALDDQFSRFDIDESGLIDTEAEINLIAAATGFVAFNEPFQLPVGKAEVDEFVELGTLVIEGINRVLFKNLAVYAFGFELQDGSTPEKDPQMVKPVLVHQETIPYGDPELLGFFEWWEDIYGTEYLETHPGDGPNGHDEVTEQILEKGKLEFKSGVIRRDWELKRAANMQEWRRCVRQNEDCGKCQNEEDHLVFEIRNAKMIEKLARKERNLIGQNVCWLKGASCISDDTCIWQCASTIRADPRFQWLMLIVNLVNVIGLMSDDTSCDPGDCNDPYQDDFLPVTDMLANVLFTLDMVNSMIVLGFASYFDNSFLILDFLVVVTGWMDVFNLLGVDVSALRALRVLRPMRLVKYFKGIQAIIGAIWFNLEPIWNVLQFMLFFLIIFGIAGITLFPGKLQHRCVVDGPYPSQTTGKIYDSEYAAVDDVGEFGEFEYFCTTDLDRVSFPFPYRCASYMTCDPTYGNPHHGATHFDNFGAAFLLMFQVQTLSTWYEMDYWTQMTNGWYTTVYYQMIVFLVGFIVSQLFIAVVCFGFENLEEQLSEPTFSDEVIGNPYIEQEFDPDDNLCKCINKPVDPLMGAKDVELDRGERTGIRVTVAFLYHCYAPAPLNAQGLYMPDEGMSDEGNFSALPSPLIEPNPLIEPLEIGILIEPLEIGIDTASGPDFKGSGSGNGLLSDHSARQIPRDAANFDESLPENRPPIQRTVPKTQNQLYWEYRELMATWQQEAQQKLDDEANAPFKMALGSEKPIEMQFNFDSLSPWSNERVFSLYKMFRAQEEIDADNAIKFFKDNQGQPGSEMENELLADLIEVENKIDLPELVVHVRSYIKVEVEPVTCTNCELPKFSLSGTEKISQIKRMAFEHVEPQIDSEGNPLIPPSVEWEHCKLYSGGVLLDDEQSLYEVCLMKYDAKFDPMCHDLFLEMTLDKKESFVMSPEFDMVIVSVILLNTVFMSIAYYDAPDSYTDMLDVAEWIFNGIFAVEMIVKVYCLKGFGNYLYPISNKVDFLIVASSMTNAFIEATGLNLSFMRVLRLIKAFRVTRVIRKIESVKVIVDAAFNSLQPIVNIMMFMMVVLVVYSCMGMQLYGNQFNFDGEEEPPRENFDNFVMSFLGLFQVLTGSAWELVLYDCMRANANSYLGVPFILSFFVLSNYIILNLFIGAILANMGTYSDEDRLELTNTKKNDEITRQRLAREAMLFVNNCLSHARAEDRFDEDLTSLQEVMQQRCAKKTFATSPIAGTRFGLQITNVSMGCFSPHSAFRKAIYNLVRNPYFDSVIILVILYSSILLTMSNPDTSNDDGWKSFFRTNDVIFLVIFTVEFILKLIAYGFIWCDNVEFMLGNEQDLKELMLGDHGVPSYMYDSWNYLDLMVLVVSYVNMFSDPDGPLKVLRLLRAFRPLRMVNRIDGMKLVIMSLVGAAPGLGNVCILLFGVFIIFAILGLSLFMGKFHMCSDGESNRASCYGHIDGDFWIPMVWSNPTLGGYGWCSFDNIWDSFMALFEVSSGDSWETVMYLMADIPAEVDDAPYRDDGPLSNCLWAFFCVIFVFMGQLFMMQLFVSVIIDSFSLVEGSGLLTGDQTLVIDMKKYYTQLAPEPKPPVPDGFRKYFYGFFTSARPLPVAVVQECIDAKHVPSTRFIEDTVSVRRQIEVTKQSLETQTNPNVVTKMESALAGLEEIYALKMKDISILDEFSLVALDCQPLPSGPLYICGEWFDSVLTTCIIVNIMMMCLVHHNQSDTWERFLFLQNLVFLVIFTVEMIIKWLGLGCKYYWQSPFDAFDGFTVILGWVFVFLDAGAIAGIFRIGRVFRLVKRAPKLQNLMSTLVHTLPSISNVFMVLLLVFFIFAVISVELFGKVRYGASLNVISNMGTWPAAMHSLWRAALGNWRAVMYDAMIGAPDCTMTIDESSKLPDGSDYNDCGNWVVSSIFFVLFQVAATFCVLNLIVAIILNAFTWCYSLEPSEITAGLSVNSEHLQHFTKIWTRFDRQGTGFIGVEELKFLLAILQYQVPQLCRTGEVNQQDVPLFYDYSSFGSGENDTDIDKSEIRCRRDFEDLIDTILQYERALEVTTRLADDGIEIQNGDNTFIFNAQIDNGVMFAEENSEDAQLLKVPQLLHGAFLHHGKCRDPFKYRVLGYREADVIDGRICTPDSSPTQCVEAAAIVVDLMKVDSLVLDDVKIEVNLSASATDCEGAANLVEAEPIDTSLSKEDLGAVSVEDGEPNAVKQGSDKVAIAEKEDWLQHKQGICQYYFNRYDLDASGTINSAEELTSLTINLIANNKIQLNANEVDAITKPVVEKVENGAEFTLDDFMNWFYDDVVAPHSKPKYTTL